MKMLASIRILTLLSACILAGSVPVTIFSENCGKSLNTTHADWRVVGGTDAAVGEFPWQIIITLAHENKGEPDANNFCGGSIINERWILTAGHCVYHTKENTLKIRLGVHNFKINEKDKEVNIFVEKLVPHEGFNQNPFVVANDIALIKLNESLDFSGKHKQLSPICLTKSDSKLTNKCVASGFGFINTKRERPVNGILQKVDVPYADPNLCRFNFIHFNETQQVCAGGLPAGGHAVCNGDSGGPLQCLSEDGRWHEVGIVSYGKPCALPGKPDIYTKVAAFQDWIEKSITTH